MRPEQINEQELQFKNAPAGDWLERLLWSL